MNPIATPTVTTVPAAGGGSGDRPEARRLNKACSELESLFIHQLFQQMRATVPKSGLLGGGSTEELYTSMLDQEMAKELAARGGIGLAALLRDQLAERAGGSEIPETETATIKAPDPSDR